MLKSIVVLAVNARWAHTAFGARSLIANLGDLRNRAELVEKTITDRPVEIVEAVLDRDPAIVGIGVYVWNAAVCAEVVSMIKALRPELPVVLGGPEVICRDDLPPVAKGADHVISGEAEVAFRRVCEQLLSGGDAPPGFIVAEPPDLAQLEPAYDLYSDEDLAHRKLYVEASRGCPYGCKFCLSSLDERVRKVPIKDLLSALDILWRCGARHFKFVDRALHFGIGPQVLEFFLERFEEGAFLHFELVPDHFPRHLGELLARFPEGSVQLEAGVQSLDPEVAERIGRHQDLDRVEETFRYLRWETGVHIHADLIVGLPGESMDGFGAGFDRLFSMQPHEIQIGLLKRLRGTAVAREADGWGLIFNSEPPYEVLQSDQIDFRSMQRLRRFARSFDLVFNNGNFPGAAALLLHGISPFDRFLRFSDWLYEMTGQSHRIALNRLARLLALYLNTELEIPGERVATVLGKDFENAGRSPIRLQIDGTEGRRRGGSNALPGRQRRHLD
ncbi:MAG: DUF4080 domain-containing protein [Thermoanaerobaculales bacterium]|nr:DUF4080 domain-containing protein [Thermoanaerobaculales bacterium]